MVMVPGRRCRGRLLVSPCRCCREEGNSYINLTIPNFVRDRSVPGGSMPYEPQVE